MSPQEATTRMEDFERIKAVVDGSRPYIRKELTDAFFAAVEYPVYAAAAMSRKILSDSTESHRAYEEIQMLTRKYNEMRGGKWRGLMDAAPRRLPVFEDVHARLTGSSSESTIIYNACNYVDATDGCQPIQMLGHSMNAVAIPKGGEVTYEFDTSVFPSFEEEWLTGSGKALLYTAMIPTQPNDKGDLRYEVTLDDQAPVIISLKEKYRSESWKQNVLRGQALKQIPVKICKGKHSLKIKALDDHIILDQWMLELKHL
jgi:hypothetical protein